MSDTLLERARRLKSEGFDYGKIRSYLSAAGYSDEHITMVFRRLDDEEIHEIYQKQQFTKLKTQLLVSLLLVLVGIVYNIFRYGKEAALDPITLLVPFGIFAAIFYKYRALKRRNFSTPRIIQENRRALK